MMGMDNFGNVHCFDNDYSYTIFVFWPILIYY
jgi:hypothetical protein